MNDGATKDSKKQVLGEALKHVAFDGWTNEVLIKAGEAQNIARDELDQLFPRGSLDLLEAFSHAADDAMTAGLEAVDLGSFKIRVRISLSVLLRIEYLQKHREASLRAASILALPTHTALSAQLLARTVDLAWRGIGDTSTDFNFYTKRATLALVLSSTTLYWMTDESQDLAPTWDFLDRRIDNVMQFEKAKAKVSDAVSQFPSPAEFLATIRYSGSRFKV